MLLALAADWRARATETRAHEPQARLNGQGKQTAPADLLEGCAGALLAALDGEEGK